MIMRLVYAFLLLVYASVAGDVIRRGQPIPPSATRVALADLVAKPQAFAGQPIVTAGIVEKSCWIAGCWMRIAPSSGDRGLRVTFKDGAFTVPRGIAGKQVNVFGQVRITAKGATFIASGVELGRHAAPAIGSSEQSP